MNIKATDTASQGAFLREYELVGDRSKEPHYFRVQTELVTYSSKGAVKGIDSYQELLKVEPGNRSDGEPDRSTCARFYVQHGDDPKVTIPSLENFSYEVNNELLDEFELDEKGQQFGVPEDKFDDLANQTGAKLSIDAAYQVYSAFFYYHAFTSYAEPTSDGNGLQNLKEIGDKVVHEAAFYESPLPGKLARAGSYWKNGEVTLEFKGLRKIDGQACAILGLDSGVCPWSMPMTYMPIFNLKTTGVSHYIGDIFLDLNSYWVRKLELVLFELTSTTMWGIPVDKSIPRTRLTIRAIRQDEFDQA